MDIGRRVAGLASKPPGEGERENRLLAVDRRIKLHPLVERVVNFLFPEPASCPLCGQPFPREAKGLSPVRLCERCDEGVAELIGGVCRTCGRPGVGPHCAECEESGHVFRTARAFASYQGTVEVAIKAYKYQGQTRLGPLLSSWVTEAYLRYYGDERDMVVVPVPMHPVKKANRGYNQAEVFAKSLAKTLHMPYVEALVRTSSGESQALHTRRERKQTVENPFAPASSAHVRRKGRDHVFVSGQRVLLVDDVLTTGSTADACAEILYRQGAAAVHVVTVAR